MTANPTISLLLVAFGHLMDNLNLSYTQVGVVALVASIGTSIAQPFFGYLSDRWNPRAMSALSIAWIGVMMGTVGLAPNYGLLVVVVGLGMLGSAAFHPPAATIASSCARARRGAAVSIFSVGGSVGSALSPLWVVLGMRWWGLSGTLVLAPSALVASGLLYWLLGRTNGAAEQPRGGAVPVGEDRSWVHMGLVVLAVMAVAWFQVTVKTYLPIWIEEQGLPIEVGGNMLVVLLASMGVGSVLGGALSDRIGRWQLFALAMGLVGPVALLFLASFGLIQWLLVGLIGMLIGAVFPVSIVMAQETWPKRIGVASGLVMGLGWLPGGIGASITGMIADRTNLTLALRSLMAPAAVGVVCILAYAVLRRSVAGAQVEAVQ